MKARLLNLGLILVGITLAPAAQGAQAASVALDGLTLTANPAGLISFQK